MSIKNKLSLIFTVVVLIILVANNAIHYIRSKNNLVNYNEREISLLAEELSYQVETAKEGSLYVENIIGRELRTASIAIRNSLPANYEDISNEQLIELAKEVMVSHITLLAKTDNDIIGVKSSDPHEIDMSTKGWGYWYDAFQQLFDEKPVDVGIGLTLEDYWAGPIEVASSNPDHTDKWGYYYDGTTNYIINPYLRDNEVLEFEMRFGPGNVMEEWTNNLEGVLELTVFNPKNFGKADEVVHLNGNQYIRISSLPYWYGTYDYMNEEVDSEHIQMAVKSGKTTSYIDTLNNHLVQKTFVPMAIDSDDPYVIGLTYNYDLIQNELNKELKEYILSSIAIMFIVLLISMVFSNSITKPIEIIIDHVNDISKGNFDKRLRLKRKDELGNLARNVNALSKDLETYMDDLKKSQEVIEYQAYHDPLTTLPNRRFLQEKLLDMVEKSAVNQSTVAVIFMDIDRFKHINDSMGHGIGDTLIKMISERIKSCLSFHDSVVARHGGDEFIILLNDSSEQRVESIGKEIITELKQPYYLQGTEVYIGASCGISLYPEHTKDLETLIMYADSAMYEAKKQGGNKVVIYRPNAHINKRLQIETRLRKAIIEEKLEVYYQPKLNAKTNEIIGVEGLARWNDEELGFVSPATFIPISEETGLIQPLFELMMRKSMIQMKEWNDRFAKNMTVSVNVSPRQFLDSQNLVDSIKNAIESTSFPSELFEIEITEGTLLQNTVDTISVLQALKKLGIKISIDDFGTGYSSLSYLKHLPIDILKIDQSFIKDIQEDGLNTEITDVIISLAKSLKLKVLAEGVEEEYQKEYLLKNQCYVMQGYLFSKPINAIEFEMLFLKNEK